MIFSIEGLVTEATPGPTAAEPALVSAAGSFDERFALARQRLLRICVGLVGADDAEDVVQDLYLRARSRRHQLRDIAAFDAWLARAAINLCFNQHRSRHRLLTRLPDLLGRRAAPESDLGLRELIERLPARQRTVVVLHYGHGYRLDEIATVLGLTAVNVRTILFRARRHLGEHVLKAER